MPTRVAEQGKAGEGRKEGTEWEGDGIVAVSQSAAESKSGGGVRRPKGDFRERYGVRG